MAKLKFGEEAEDLEIERRESSDSPLLEPVADQNSSMWPRMFGGSLQRYLSLNDYLQVSGLA